MHIPSRKHCGRAACRHYTSYVQLILLMCGKLCSSASNVWSNWFCETLCVSSSVCGVILFSLRGEVDCSGAVCSDVGGYKHSGELRIWMQRDPPKC
jgi:hypothetical protein